MPINHPSCTPKVSDGSLTVLSIAREDRGAYTCRATSPQGEAIHTTRLLVQGTHNNICDWRISEQEGKCQQNIGHCDHHLFANNRERKSSICQSLLHCDVVTFVMNKILIFFFSQLRSNVASRFKTRLLTLKRVRSKHAVISTDVQLSQLDSQSVAVKCKWIKLLCGIKVVQEAAVCVCD